MTLLTLAGQLQKPIVVTQWPNQPNRWCAYINSAWVKKHFHSHEACSEYGVGRTPTAALKNYCKLVSNRYVYIGDGLTAHIAVNTKEVTLC